MDTIELLTHGEIEQAPSLEQQGVWLRNGWDDETGPKSDNIADYPDILKFMSEHAYKFYEHAEEVAGQYLKAREFEGSVYKLCFYSHAIEITYEHGGCSRGCCSPSYGTVTMPYEMLYGDKAEELRKDNERRAEAEKKRKEVEAARQRVEAEKRRKLEEQQERQKLRDLAKKYPDVLANNT